MPEDMPGMGSKAVEEVSVSGQWAVRRAEKSSWGLPGKEEENKVGENQTSCVVS